MKDRNNGPGPAFAGETDTLERQPGAAELGRFLAARAAGQPPDPDDVQALRSLRPQADGPQPGPGDPEGLIADLHGPDPQARARAWGQLETLLPPAPLEPIPLSQVAPPPPRDWLIEDWLPRGRVGMLTGAGSRGKSWLAAQLAAAMAGGGGEWLPRSLHGALPEAAGGPVLYATWEDELSEFVRRLGRARAAQAAGLHLIDLAGAGPLWGLDPGAPAGRAYLLPLGAQLRAAAERIGARLLVIDPLAAAYGGNENDRAAVREFMASWDGWGRATDCTPMLIAHPPKDQELSGRGGYSGSTDWHGASRWRWELAPAPAKDDKRERLNCAKASYAMPPDPVYLERVQESAEGLIRGQWKEAADQSANGGGNDDDGRGAMI